ncbi:hypothetical protein EMGBS5_09100, partial [Clavibacter sp.]
RIALKGPQIAYGYLEGGFPIQDGWFMTVTWVLSKMEI